MRAAHVIGVASDPFGLMVDVTVRPAPAASDLDREFHTASAALDYAGELAREHGWRIEDRSAERPSFTLS